ncbi:MAG TPA: hypothetical protein VF665_14975 [Longimicrobium sp.]|jgi:hypothetical protein|uniref:hypothetical protein n=1 Tax=Longimicrobium sp. TaxID=2029185 RepID=UPI002ED9EEC2
MLRKLLAILRGGRHPAGASKDDATAYLRGSRANAARLDSAIGDLNAGRGALTDMAALRDRLGEAAAR